MRNSGWARAFAVTAALLARPALAQTPAPDGFQPLLSGRDLSGWWGLGTEDPRAVYAAPDLERRKAESLADIAQHWRVEDGTLINDGQGLYLTTDETYADFELRLEYRTAPRADSGIYLRGMPQVQIWDTTEAGGNWPAGGAKGSGGLWNNSEAAAGKDPLVRADRPFGEWNAVRIVMVGERVSVWLNEQLVVDHARLENYFDRTLPLPREGPIQLQTHGGEVAWRNIFLREISPEEANQILASHRDAGFVPAFNGTDLSGWAGAVEEYEVVDGALRCRAGRAGTLYTERQYGDFAARFEFKLPPGGNNGLAIRYPGEGDPAYSGMCELQVLDSEHPTYASLDPRQYHGSVYGQAAAHRGYLRPAGEWNFQAVRVVGPR
ncbi:MAG TPA: DUF1080 domain-containing protein, partial [Phycisphaerales bacterium]|nr:DUF1080 domain-containing protein [Phycisphaerales bacterium]